VTYPSLRASSITSASAPASSSGPASGTHEKSVTQRHTPVPSAPATHEHPSALQLLKQIAGDTGEHGLPE